MLVNHSDIQRRFRSLAPFLDERMRRLVAASESKAIGYGGVSVVARASGVSRRAITEGIKEQMSGVNYFFSLTTTISPYQRQLLVDP